MNSPLLSPGRASDRVLREALPGKMALYSCKWDLLLVEDEKFRNRLQDVGKEVGGYMIKEEAHAWDKKPHFCNPEVYDPPDKRRSKNHPKKKYVRQSNKKTATKAILQWVQDPSNYRKETGKSAQQQNRGGDSTLLFEQCLGQSIEKGGCSLCSPRELGFAMGCIPLELV